MNRFIREIEVKKKSVLIGIILFITLTSCTPLPFNYDNSVLRETVVRIELIYYDQPAVRRVSDFFGNAYRDHLDFDFELVEYIETLNEFYHESFFEKLSNINMHNAVNQNNAPNGFAILLHYENGDFDVFASLYVGRFNSEGEFIEFLADGLWSEPFRELVEYHFNYEFTDDGDDSSE